MALGGVLSGVIFDVTGSYKAAFVNGILWNLVNVSIAAWLMVPGQLLVCAFAAFAGLLMVRMLLQRRADRA